jgi:hypothetical protein
MPLCLSNSSPQNTKQQRTHKQLTHTRTAWWLQRPGVHDNVRLFTYSCAYLLAVVEWNMCQTIQASSARLLTYLFARSLASCLLLVYLHIDVLTYFLMYALTFSHTAWGVVKIIAKYSVLLTYLGSDALDADHERATPSIAEKPCKGKCTYNRNGHVWCCRWMCMFCGQLLIPCRFLDIPISVPMCTTISCLCVSPMQTRIRHAGDSTSWNCNILCFQ